VLAKISVSKHIVHANTDMWKRVDAILENGAAQMATKVLSSSMLLS
jgi:hypothetical protein